jgi:hypothetical protein
MGVYDFVWWMFGWREMLKLSSQHFNRMGIVQINIGASLIIDTCKKVASPVHLLEDQLRQENKQWSNPSLGKNGSNSKCKPSLD